MMILKQYYVQTKEYDFQVKTQIFTPIIDYTVMIATKTQLYRDI